MKRFMLACALLTLLTSSCGTANSVRWAYGANSAFDEPGEFAERNALRATVGVPLILVAAGFDAVTWPFQLLFGVWPMWGDASTMMKPRAD